METLFDPHSVSSLTGLLRYPIIKTRKRFLYCLGLLRNNEIITKIPLTTKVDHKAKSKYHILGPKSMRYQGCAYIRTYV